MKLGTNVLGRHPGNDIQIIEGTISGKHCELDVTANSVMLCDLGSRNGCFLADKKITAGSIPHGANIRFGSVEAVVELEGEVRVEIPKQAEPEQKWANFLDDGTQACQNHPTVPGEYQCTKCLEVYCQDCIRVVGLASNQGRGKLAFCPSCNGPIMPLALQAPPKEEKKTFFDKLGETLLFKKKK